MRPGFSLFELLVAVTVIAILASLLIPVFGQVRDGARRTRCAQNQRQIWTGMMAFTQDHNGILLPWERAQGQDPVWWPAILIDYLEVTQAMMDGSQDSRYRKQGYNVLADCPDWHPHGSTWNGFYTVWERDQKSLGYAYTEHPTRDWEIGVGGYTNGWGGAVPLAKVSHPDQRIAFFDSDDSRADPTPSTTIREGSWNDPEEFGGTIWKRGARHRGRPNWVLFSGRIVSTTTQEQCYWTALADTPFLKREWLRMDTRDWRWGDSAFFNGLEMPGRTTF